MLDIDLFNDEYEKYKKVEELLIKKKQELSDFRKNHEDISVLLPIYNILVRDERLKPVYLNSRIKNNNNEINGDTINNTGDYLRKYRRKLSEDFMDENPHLKKFLLLKEDCNKLETDLDSIVYESEIVEVNERYIILKEDNNRELMSLYSKEKMDISMLDNDEYDFFLNVLRRNSSYVGEIDIIDLPLILNLTNQYDEYGLDNLKVYSDSRNIEDEFSKEINGAIAFAKKFDNSQVSIEQLRELKELLIELDKKKRRLKQDEYFKKYVTLKILETHDVEGLYKDTSNKILFLDTYFDLSHFGYEIKKDNYFDYGKILTASSLINRELLENRELIKKRRYNKIIFN